MTSTIKPADGLCQMWIRQACLLEARARKPGNVHPEASFVDLCYEDFVVAADAVAEVLPQTSQLGIGPAVLAAVMATRSRLSRPTNPNLGIILLLAPLAAVPAGTSLPDGIESILSNLTVADAASVYRAINLSLAGGLGKVEEADVQEPPTITLRQAMALAADRDSIASEYQSGFQIVLQTGVPFLARWPDFSASWEAAIIHLQLTLISRWGDTLIRRKCGESTSHQAAEQARAVLEAGGVQTDFGRRELERFDQWLRADGHRRNPGTTADLIAASLFAAARDGMIRLDSLST